MAGIPFKTEFDFEYGRCDQLSPLIRRVIANNPSPFTLPALAPILSAPVMSRSSTPARYLMRMSMRF